MNLSEKLGRGNKKRQLRDKDRRSSKSKMHGNQSSARSWTTSKGRNSRKSRKEHSKRRRSGEIWSDANRRKKLLRKRSRGLRGKSGVFGKKNSKQNLMLLRSRNVRSEKQEQASGVRNRRSMKGTRVRSEQLRKRRSGGRRNSTLRGIGSSERSSKHTRMQQNRRSGRRSRPMSSSSARSREKIKKLQKRQ